jgi:hypothetical protein
MVRQAWQQARAQPALAADGKFGSYVTAIDALLGVLS